MGLFNLFKKDTQAASPLPVQVQADMPIKLSPEVNDLQEKTNDMITVSESSGIDAVYSFLQDDYESKGYSDALTNPDESYKKDNIRLIKLDLKILIQKASTYYEDLSVELDMHIATRGRAGLIDLVQELEMRKRMVADHKAKVEQIQADIEKEDGMSQRIILSYQRGFMRGLSALSQSKVLNKKI
jgi:hypothetical protein